MKLRNFLGIVLAIAVLLWTSHWLPSLASHEPPQKPINCDRPQTTYEMNRCASQKTQATDRQLNQLYQQILPKISGKQKARLTNAQLAWIKFRDETCNYEAGWYEGGTLSSPTYGYCIARITQQRVEDLKQYLHQEQL